MQNVRTLGQPLLGEKFLVVCKPILVFSFDFGQVNNICATSALEIINRDRNKKGFFDVKLKPVV